MKTGPSWVRTRWSSLSFVSSKNAAHFFSGFDYSSRIIGLELCAREIQRGSIVFGIESENFLGVFGHLRIILRVGIIGNIELESENRVFIVAEIGIEFINQDELLCR